MDPKSMKQEAMLKVLSEIADMAHSAMGHKLSGLKAKPYAGSESEAEEDAEKEGVASGKVSLTEHAKAEAKEFVKGGHPDKDEEPGEYEDEDGEENDATKLLKLKAKLGK